MKKYDLIDIINKYENLVESFFSKRVYNINDIEDLVQEVFIEFLKVLIVLTTGAILLHILLQYVKMFYVNISGILKEKIIS